VLVAGWDRRRPGLHASSSRPGDDPAVTPPPLLSVVIPVHDRAPLLRQSLASLAAQRLPAGCVEVIVVDDASTDDPAGVAAEFADRLRLRTHVLAPQGFRSAARNAGARLATAPVLAFIDAGVSAGPGFARAYLDAHRAVPVTRSAAFIGYTPGYDLLGAPDGLAARLAELPPERVLAHYAAGRPLLDMRHEQYERIGYRLERLHLPWALFWTVNVSVRRADFEAVGGFDEGFRTWGVEDVEFGYRLVRHGVRLGVCREAWAIDGPHERDLRANRRSGHRNAELFWQRHRTLETEMYWAVCGRWHGVALDLEQEYGALLDWARVAEPDVSGELAAALTATPPGHRVAVFGCGGTVPAGMAPDALVDFDAALLNRAAGRHPAALHAAGIRTGLPAGAFDTVVITSRLAGLWPRWGALITEEAARIGHEVRRLF
jgi:glycosyltransferase involved in cell wall biosynthesis